MAIFIHIGDLGCRFFDSGYFFTHFYNIEYLPSDEGCHQQGEHPYNHPLIVERQVRRPPHSNAYSYYAKNESCDAGYYRYVFPHIIRCKSGKC